MMLEIKKVTKKEKDLNAQTKKAILGVDKDRHGYVGICNPVCGPRFCCPETGWLGGK